MPILQKTDSAAVISVPTASKHIDDLLNKEWLLTNSRGGYASSTIVGCNTRRYHGLLVGSLNPPVNRIMALANCIEMIISNGRVSNLSTFEFDNKFTPAGFGFIKQFRKNTAVHFDYKLDHLKMTKSICLLRDTDTVALVYDFTKVSEPAVFVLMPFVGLRDFHALQKSYAPLCFKQQPNGLLIRHNVPKSCQLLLNCSPAEFEPDRQWWFNFIYRSDRERGQDFTEDLWTPGFFKCRIESPTKVVFWASLSNYHQPSNPENLNIEKVSRELRGYQDFIISASKTKDEKFTRLCLAADQFIVTRCPQSLTGDTDSQTTGDGHRATILAGFPWFADWGRDAFVALPGLLLSTGRFDEAKSVLATFAQAADNGMIPNRFDDTNDTAYFNSVDASFWFINAAFQYLNTTGDSQVFNRKLLPTICSIVDSFHRGTRFGICADTDGLITAGNEHTQLTWMDAKYDGVAFTARYGKAVEINALWYNSLCWLRRFFEDSGPEKAQYYRSMAEKVETNFRQSFWNETTGYLNDCILPDGTPDTTLRPNQIFAVSLPFSPLLPAQQKSVVDTVRKELLTPYGLRTLSPADSRYQGTYTGPQQQRDQAYHQGTVWPYLIGPFVESFLKVHDFSSESKKRAAEFIKPLMQHLIEDQCLGQICEIFDGDPPHKSRGCFAQAWSVAELIRVYQLIYS